MDTDRPTTEQEHGQEQEQPRIYQVTDGLKSVHTKEAYQIGFNQFLKVTVKNNDLRTLIDTKPSVIESKIISHIEYLKNVRKLKYWSIQVYCSGILNFFKMNDVVLNTNKIKRFLPSDDNEHYGADRPYSITEIQQILDKCDVRARVIILLMASTGMKVGALSGLRIGDIKKMSEFNLYLIWVYNSSKKDRYYTFCTPECAGSGKWTLQMGRVYDRAYRERWFLNNNNVIALAITMNSKRLRIAFDLDRKGKFIFYNKN